ncbi:MAG: GYD domain-containing protein [Gemmatimonadetes bacterium]|nr:MAG: GYD domain-containing protein [Gemmatimonadota bacterium]
MAIYMLLTKLSPESMSDLSKVEKNAHCWKSAVEKKCPKVKFLSHYFVLGPYDFVSLYEAPDEKTAAKVSMISMSLGAQKAESWTLIPYPDYIQDVRELLE